MSLTTSRQFVLQTFLAASVLTQTQIEELENILSDKFNEEATAFPLLVGEINKAITDFDLEIKKVHKVNSEVVWVVINRNGDEIAQVASGYSAQEIVEIKKLIELICNSSTEFVINPVDFLNSLQHLTKKAGDLLLNRLKESLWIEPFERNRVTLGCRLLVELKTYLVDEYGDKFADCVLCRDIVGLGICCERCDARIHRHCLHRLKDAYSTPKCEKCGDPYNLP